MTKNLTRTAFMILGAGAALLSGCETDPSKNAEIQADSIENQEITYPSAPDHTAVAPELLGAWVLDNLTAQGMVIPLQGADTLTFSPDGALTTANATSKASGNFVQREEYLDSDLWNTTQYILELNPTTLILVDTVDQAPVKYAYRKI